MPEIFSQPARSVADYQVHKNGGRRYKLPHPVTGELQYWTSATTLAGAAKDSYAIHEWDTRVLLSGISMRPDLVDAAAAAETVQEYKEVADRCRDAGGGNYGSTMGSAIHKYSEHADNGRWDLIPQNRWPLVKAYYRALEDSGIVPLREFTEQVVVVPEVGVAGCVDRVIELDDILYIGDVKTSKDIKYGLGDFAVQLALYAHATHIWDVETESYLHMPTVDQTKAAIFWLPLDPGDECRIVWLDIAAGWDMVPTLMDVRRYRSSVSRLVLDS